MSGLYKIKKVDEENFELVELQTEHNIMSYKTYESARNQYNFMNNGGSFNGWTPSFILTKTLKA